MLLYVICLSVSGLTSFSMIISTCVHVAANDMTTALNFSTLTSVHTDSIVNLQGFLDNSFCKFKVLYKWRMKCVIWQA